jgi:hypothetical protein
MFGAASSVRCYSIDCSGRVLYIVMDGQKVLTVCGHFSVVL